MLSRSPFLALSDRSLFPDWRLELSLRALGSCYSGARGIKVGFLGHTTSMTITQGMFSLRSKALSAVLTADPLNGVVT